MSPGTWLSRDGDGKLAFPLPLPNHGRRHIREHLPPLITASRLLGGAPTIRAKLEPPSPRLHPYQINHRGYLQE